MTKEEALLKPWFLPQLTKKDLNTLLKRDNWHGLWWIGGWFVLLVAAGVVAWFVRDTWWAIPAFLVYGVLYTAAEPRTHETNHGTVFKTPWLNTLTNFVTTTMGGFDVVTPRWNHTGHHSFTLIRQFDHEILTVRPPNLFYVLLDFFYIKKAIANWTNLIVHSFGKLTKLTKEIVPPEEHQRLFWLSRVVVLIFAGVVAACFWTQSLWPLLYFGLPRFYGGFLTHLFNLSQHVGMEEEVWDHRINTRTCRMNPVFRFLYMNMNYHIEHHLYPLVPFHALPKLHAMIKDELPAPYPGFADALADVFRALFRQGKEPQFSTPVTLPTKAGA